MVLIAIVGELGIGKTLTLAYMTWNNYVKKKREIYTNMPVYGIPHIPIKSVNDLLEMIPPTTDEKEIFEGKEKFFAGDELWRWIDSRMVGVGSREKNKVITSILIASRKSFVTIAYTAQALHLIDKRILDVTDLVFTPQISPDNSYTTVFVFSGGRKPYPSGIDPFRFNNEPIYMLYNTFYKVQDIEETPTISSKKITPHYYPPIKNPAWIWYLTKMYNFSQEEIEKITKEFESRINSEDYPDLVIKPS